MKPVLRIAWRIIAAGIARVAAETIVRKLRREGPTVALPSEVRPGDDLVVMTRTRMTSVPEGWKLSIGGRHAHKVVE